MTFWQRTVQALEIYLPLSKQELLGAKGSGLDVFELSEDAIRSFVPDSSVAELPYFVAPIDSHIDITGFMLLERIVT